MNRSGLQTWTAERDQVLIDGSAAEESAAVMAAKLGVTRNAVLGRLHRLNHGIAKRRVSVIAGAPRPAPLSAPQLQAIRDFNAQGLNYIDTALRIGLPVDRVRKAGKDMGLRPKALRQNADQILKARLNERAERPTPPASAVPMIERFAEGFDGQTGRVDLMGLTPAMCRFPIDQPGGEVRFCGLAKEEDGIYCAGHAARCFNATPPIKLAMVRPAYRRAA